MEIIGFIVTLLAGGYFLLNAIGGLYAILGFTGRIGLGDGILLAILAAIGASLLYVSLTHSPFVVTVR